MSKPKEMRNEINLFSINHLGYYKCVLQNVIRAIYVNS